MVNPETLTGEELWGRPTAGQAGPPAAEVPGPVSVAHVVDAYNRYPGETVTFFTRVDLQEPLADLALRISLPRGLTLKDYRAPAGMRGLIPATEVEGGLTYLVWPLAGELPAGTHFEYQAVAAINPTLEDLRVDSQAVITANNRTVLAQETVTLAIRARGEYLRHLPSIYETDEMMGRLVMLFESFWAPVETQLDNIHYYFDPRVTPAALLPWLASWLDLELVDGWPEQRLRQLIRWAIALHRSRGTKWGLLKYLEIFTGQRAEIIERRAKNFILGPEARLGPGIALGHGNRPHTFAVRLRLPPLEAENEAEQARREQMRRRTIVAIIEMQKPAHTVYELDLKIRSADDDGEEQPDPAAGPAAEAEVVDEIAAQAAIWFKLDDEPAPPEAQNDRSAKRNRKGGKS